MPRDVCAGKNRLWIIYNNSAQYSSRYDKSMGYDYSSGLNLDGRLAVFNGKGMYTYGRTSTVARVPGTEDFQYQGMISDLFWFNDKIYMTSDYENVLGNAYFYASTNEVANTGNKAWSQVTSIFDADFAMIDKALDNIELVFDGNVSSDQDITLEYRTTGFDGSTGWSALGTIKSQSRVKDYVFRTLPNGVIFKRLQLRLSGTTDCKYGTAKLVIRYMLSPDMKWQWQFTANCYGDDKYAPLLLADDTEGSQLVSLLRGNLYNARMSDNPIKFLDIDQFDLSGAHNNSTTTITLNTTNILKESGFIQIDDEIIQFTGKTSTTLTGCQRGALGTAAATHADNAKVFAVYRVIVRAIQNERIELTNLDDLTEDKSRNSDLQVLIQEV